MKKYKLLIYICFFSSSLMANEYYNANVVIKFTPEDRVSDYLCGVISQSHGDVLLMGSKFTSKAFSDCLINIKKQGRHVRLVLDSKFINNNISKLTRMLKSGICVYSDSMHNTAHNKFIISGNDFVFSGSYNFSDDSEYKNAENGVFIRSFEINQTYTTEFFKHLNHSILLESNFGKSDQCSKNKKF